MAEYGKHEAREWAKTTMKGVANTITPTFTHDLRSLNERAIRHDVRKEIEYGFWGTLLVAEAATTLDEYVQFAQWAAEESKGNLHRPNEPALTSYSSPTRQPFIRIAPTIFIATPKRFVTTPISP